MRPSTANAVHGPGEKRNFLGGIKGEKREGGEEGKREGEREGREEEKKREEIQPTY